MADKNRAAVKKPAPKNTAPKKTASMARKGRPGFARETKAARVARTHEIIARLKREYPDAHCSLVHRNPFELTVATILSAQCTDDRVNMTTPALFARYPDAESLAGANQEELEGVIKSTGFFRNKAKSLLGMAAHLVEHHNGEVPDEMDALVALPGVGRKTANVVLGNAFGRNEGVVVDTHVTRLATRLGLTKAGDAVAIEKDLLPLVPRDDWTIFSHLLIDHGRAVCKAPTPRQSDCVLCDICRSCVL
ncbi:MAG: endonuclease III [Longimicrobiales bacterium]